MKYVFSFLKVYAIIFITMMTILVVKMYNTDDVLDPRDIWIVLSGTVLCTMYFTWQYER